jgi:TolB protein
VGWSDNSEQVTFVSSNSGNFEVYAVNLRGNRPVNLTNNDDDDLGAALSPDGKQLAFISTRGGNWDIYVMDMDSGEAVNVTRSASWDSTPAWWP